MSICSALCALALLAAPAEPAQPQLAEARAAFEARDMARAFELYTRLADTPARGEALYVLGVVYQDGWGVVPADPETAQELVRRAAEAGHPPALSWLAMAQWSGEGEPQDPEAALELWRRAAELGDDGAAYSLGIAYAYGRRQPAEAAPWFRRAAETGHLDAMIELARLLQRGEGVDRDPVQAVALYRRAALAGEGEARRKLVEIYAGGEGLPEEPVRAEVWALLADRAGDPVSPEGRRVVAGRLTPEQKAEAVRLADRCEAVPAECP